MKQLNKEPPRPLYFKLGDMLGEIKGAFKSNYIVNQPIKENRMEVNTIIREKKKLTDKFRLELAETNLIALIKKTTHNAALDNLTKALNEVRQCTAHLNGEYFLGGAPITMMHDSPEEGL